MGGGQGQGFIRNDFSEQFQQFSAAGFNRDSAMPTTMSNINCNGAPIRTGHPPGFSTFSRLISSDNGTESHSSAPTVSSSPEGEGSGVGVIGNRRGQPRRMSNCHNYYMLTEPVTNQIELDNNLEKVAGQLLLLTASTTSSSTNETALALNNWNFANSNGTTRKSSADGNNNGGATCVISSFKESQKKEKDRNQHEDDEDWRCEINAKSNGSADNFLDEFISPEDEHDEESDDGSRKWCEKKSRRRAPSKGDRIKSEMHFEKKLYGLFACPTCKARWGSSQSVLNMAQTCRYCKTQVHPYNQGPILSRKQLELSKQESSAEVKKEQGLNK